jgi:hypothetical protein
MTYTVKYLKKNQWFWRTIKKVKGDYVATDVPGGQRIFILEDETRVEVPGVGTEFVFSSNRFLLIKQQMEEKAGQKIPVK